MDENEGNLFLNDEDVETNIIIKSNLTINERTNALKQAKSNNIIGIENIRNAISKCTRITFKTVSSVLKIISSLVCGI